MIASGGLSINELLLMVQEAFAGNNIVFMIPIIICMIFGLAIAAERLYAIAFRSNMNKTMLMKKVQDAIYSNKIGDAIKVCQTQEQSGRLLPRVIKAGLSKANRTDKEIEAALEQASLEVFPELTKRTQFLPMIANVATLSGLLGTIMGLIIAFKAVAGADPAKKQILLAQGISTAMYTTAGGLVVAIPILVANGFVQTYMTKIMDEIDMSAAECLNLLRARKLQGGSSENILSK
jgi:biopolymer transport protein ExbB/TolQ